VRQSPPGAVGVRKQGFGWLKGLALLPLPLFIVLIVVFTYTDTGTAFEPPYLLAVLNILFIALIPFTIAYLAWRSYADGGRMRLFYIGCGMVAFGLGAAMAGIAVNVNAGLNTSVTIFNSGALLAAILFVAAAISSLINAPRYKLTSYRALRIGLCYLAVFLVMSFLCIASYENLVPTFFVQGAGPTVLRQFVLGIAAALFAISSVIFLIVYSRSRADFTYWFSLALAIIAIGLIVVFFQKVVGSPVGWVGRAAQYLGCVYLLVGIVVAYRISNIKQIPLENEFARSFNYLEANYKTLVEMAPNAVISCDKQSRILTWNPAAAMIFGYKSREAIGAYLQELILPRESAVLLNSELQKLEGQVERSSSKIETTARRKQGEDFPVEVSMAVEEVSGERLGTFIIRDITENKRAEKALRESEERFAAAFNMNPDPTAISVPETGQFVDINPAFEKWAGYSRYEIIGRTSRELNLLVNPADRDALVNRLRNHEPVEDMEITFRVRSGEMRDTWFTARTVFIGGSEYLLTRAHDVTELKKAGEDLLKAKERFLRISQISTDIAYSCVTGPDGVYHIDWLSGATERTTGYTADEIMAQSCWHYFVIEEDKPLFEKNAIGLSPGQSASCDMRIRSKSGQIIWVRSFAECVTDNINSKLLRLHGGLSNISERKHAEEKTLRQSTVLTAINRVFEEALRCETDVEVAGACLSVAQELTGSKFGWIGEVNADGHLDTIALSDPGWDSCRMAQSQAVKMIMNMQVRGIWGRVLKDGKSLITNDPARHPDSVGLPQGHSELTAFMGVPLKHAGQTVGMIALANKPGGYDIHDREAIEALAVAFEGALSSKRAEEAILRSKLLLQSVIDSTPDWMYVKDFQHRFLLVNKSFAEAQNIIPQDMIGRADSDFFSEELCLGNPDKGMRGFHADDNQAFQGKTVHNPGNRITWADGSLHIYDTYKIPLADQSGKIYAALVYSRDITGQRKAEYEREASFKTIQKTLRDVINTMSKIVEMRDPYTSGHQGRVAGLAGAIAREMKLEDSRVEHLMMAASIHDVGKMYVPADILSKPGKLSNIEWEMIKTHVQGSYEILKDLEFSQPIALMALQHHERLDGSGYPNGLKGSEMLVEAKILAVADVVEAMSSHRPYRPALGIDKALEEISGNKGKLYDPDVVDICMKLFREQGFQFGG
jgi:PAS domain S-box-containing protein